MDDRNGVCRVKNDIAIEFRNDNIGAICTINFEHYDLYSYCPTDGGHIRLWNRTMRMFLPWDVFNLYFDIVHIWEKETEEC